MGIGQRHSFLFANFFFGFQTHQLVPGVKAKSWLGDMSKLFIPLKIPAPYIAKIVK
jgi:hypothetical protein